MTGIGHTLSAFLDATPFTNDTFQSIDSCISLEKMDDRMSKQHANVYFLWNVLSTTFLSDR